MDNETHVLESPAHSQPWYNFSEDTPVRPAHRSKSIPGPSRLIAALDAAELIEISSSEEDENVIDLTGLDETPSESKKRAITTKSKGKAVSSVFNDIPMHPMFNPSGRDHSTLKENLSRDKAISSSTSSKKAMSCPSSMRDVHPAPKINASCSTKTASNALSISEDDTDFDGARPSSRTDKPIPPASNTTAKKPYSNRSNSRTTSSTSRTPVTDDQPVAGPSHTAAPSKPQTKMTSFTYREYFPRPTVRYVTNAAEADELVEALNGPVGFDMEWVRKTALIQICDASMILLIQLSAIRSVPPKVKALIESPSIPKMGVNIRNDGVKLLRDYDVCARNLVELGALACQSDSRFEEIYHRPLVSLAKVVAFYLRRTLNKGPVRTSNWERKPLSKEQMEYAANDAYCALLVYKKLLAIAKASKRPLDPLGFTSDLLEEQDGPKPPVPQRVRPRTSTKPGWGQVELGPWRDPPAPLQQPGVDFEVPHSPTESSSSAQAQHLTAYTLWRRGDALGDICIHLRTQHNPLSKGTAISYIMGALEADSSLQFSKPGVRRLLREEDGGWNLYKANILKWEKEGRGHI